MKTSRKRLGEQRRLLDKKLAPWQSLRPQRRPPQGWLKPIREALGLTARQLAARLGTHHGNVIHLEDRESKGTATLAAVEKAARAMNCRLIYAVVPEDTYQGLEAIVDQRSKALAQKIARDVFHTMDLEDQSVPAADSEPQIERLARDLKDTLDARMWDEP